MRAALALTAEGPESRDDTPPPRQAAPPPHAPGGRHALSRGWPSHSAVNFTFVVSSHIMNANKMGEIDRLTNSFCT